MAKKIENRDFQMDHEAYFQKNCCIGNPQNYEKWINCSWMLLTSLSFIKTFFSSITTSDVLKYGINSTYKRKKNKNIQ